MLLLSAASAQDLQRAELRELELREERHKLGKNRYVDPSLARSLSPLARPSLLAIASTLTVALSHRR